MKTFVRLTLAASLLFVISSLASAQQPASAIPPCNLSLSQAPQLWGFKLGMTFEQVKERYPSVRVVNTPYHGAFDTDVIADDDARTQRNYKWLLSGVNFVNLSFIEGKLSYIGVSYTSRTISYPDIEAFTAMLSKAYGLPNAWNRMGANPMDMEMKCGEVDFMAFKSTTVGVIMFDAKAVGLLNKRLKDYQALQFSRVSR